MEAAALCCLGFLEAVGEAAGVLGASSLTAPGPRLPSLHPAPTPTALQDLRPEGPADRHLSVARPGK